MSYRDMAEKQHGQLEKAKELLNELIVCEEMSEVGDLMDKVENFLKELDE